MATQTVATRLKRIMTHRKLTDRQQRTIRGRLDGRSFEEIGAEIGCAKQNCWGLERYALRKLGFQGHMSDLMGTYTKTRQYDGATCRMLGIGYGAIDERPSIKRALTAKSPSERKIAALELIATRILKDAECGELTAEQRTAYDRAIAAVNRGEYRSVENDM